MANQSQSDPPATPRAAASPPSPAESSPAGTAPSTAGTAPSPGDAAAPAGPAPGAPAPASAGGSTAASPPPSPPAEAGAQHVRKIAKITIIALLVLFIYHLFADRFTPYTSQGTVGSYVVQVAPEISGPVVSVGVDDNSFVKKGRELFRIDPAPYAISVRSAEANLALALQAADSSAADIRVADANLTRSRVEMATSQELGGIVLDLTAKRALSETAAIRARSEIARNKADITRAVAEAERARIRLGEAGDKNAQVRQAAAALEQARLDLKRTSVVAQSDGIITNLRLSPGQFASKGSPVMTFIAARPRWVTADMRENQLGNIAPGNRAYVVFDDQPGRVLPAKVESVGWGVSQGGEAPSGTLPEVSAPTGWLREPQRFPVRIVVDPPAKGEAPLPPGRSGAQASVVVLTRESSIMNPLARIWIWCVSKLSYLQ
jgi:multidrug resistance efflux pump